MQEREAATVPTKATERESSMSEITLTPEQLAVLSPEHQRLWKLHEAATPGPWDTGLYVNCGVFEHGRGHIAPGCCAFCKVKDSAIVADRAPHEGEFDSVDITRVHVHRLPDGNWRNIYSASGVPITGNYEYEEGGVCSTKADSDFIAESRNAVPRLLRDLAEARLALNSEKVVGSAFDECQRELAEARRALREANCMGPICNEIQRIMKTYRHQRDINGFVDTPGGLEHMGDVWNLLSKWDAQITAALDAAAQGVEE